MAYQGYTTIALIPARGGSKRIPKKNIKLLCGKPLIEYTIEHAKQSAYIDRVIVSTEDKAIAEVAKDAGAEVPFLRPRELAEDDVLDFPVFVQALSWLKEHEKYVPDIVVHLRPTSPMCTPVHIDASIELLVRHPEADSVRTVTEPEQSPYKMYTLNGEYLSPLLLVDGDAESFNRPRQRLPRAYKHVGYVDAIWRRTLTEKKQMTGSKIVPLILPHAQSGINNTEDWEQYEYFMCKKKV